VEGCRKRGAASDCCNGDNAAMGIRRIFFISGHFRRVVGGGAGRFTKKLQSLRVEFLK
jgi:hypothetical protein